MTMWVLLATDGSVASQVMDLPSARDNPAGLKVVAVDRFGDVLTERYDQAAGKWVADLPKLRASLLDAIDVARETNRRLVMTQLLGQSFVYSEKGREVYDYRNVVGSILAGLTTIQLRARYPFAMAEVDATGDTLAAVIGRYEAGAATSRAEVARIDGLAVKAKRAIRAATTEAAVRAAAAVNWKAGA